MLSYQHEYHAGNHADVVKHAVLALLIDALQRKPKPIRVLDTHAGSGIYELNAPEARRGAEHVAGIARVLAVEPIPPELGRYARAVTALNGDDGLRRYPGSPQVARALLRDDDHAELFELHPRAFAALKSVFRNDPRMHLHERDAFEGLLAVLPPPERRGIVLIDPSYERSDEFRGVLDTVPAAQRRWPNGVYAVWYPMIRRPDAAGFVRQLRALELPRLFQVEVQVAPRGGFGLYGSGLVIANLPYGLDAQLKTIVPWLHATLAVDGAGSWQAKWLTPP